MKKILLSFVLFLLLTINSFAETIILKCRGNFYKYVADGSSLKTYAKSGKKKNAVWFEWPKTKVQDDNKDFLIFTDAEAIIDGYVVTEKFKQIKWKGGIATNGRTIVDFKNKTYDSKATSNGKPWSKKVKCKLQKS
tara:strand:+ start:304 stop:711 length:408 start_codon:yes stop_codon:yes gene_type:complete